MSTFNLTRRELFRLCAAAGMGLAAGSLHRFVPVVMAGDNKPFFYRLNDAQEFIRGFNNKQFGFGYGRAWGSPDLGEPAMVANNLGGFPFQPGVVDDPVYGQMLDLSVLAFRCDLTRVITFGYENTVTEQTHPWLGVNEGFHIGITHNQPGAPYIAVNTWIVSQLAYLLAQLKATPDGDGTLLDNTIVYFASEMGEGSSHSGNDLPIVIAGGGAGRITPGRLLDRPGQGNGNVLIALMHAMGVSVSTFGNGFTTALPGLVNS